MLRRVAVMFLVGLCLVDDAMARAARGQGVHEVQIEGTVQAPDGAALPGATVRVFGTSLATTSDGDGQYAMKFTHAPARLIVVVDLDNYRSEDTVVEIDSTHDDSRLHANPGVCLRCRGHRRGADAERG